MVLRGIVILSIAASAAAVGVSPVQKVQQLIQSLKAKVEKDLDTQSREFEVFARNCDKDADDKTRSIASSKATIEDLTAVIENSQATIASVESEIQDASEQISAEEGEFKELTAVRTKAKAEFVANEKELVDSVSSLSRASMQIKKGMSFAQLSAKTKSGVKAALSALEQVIDAASMPDTHMERIQALIEQQEDTQDGLSLGEQQSPEESVSSGGIVETIEDMEDKAQNTLNEVRKTEMKAAHAYAMMKSATENQLAALNKELSAATAKKQSTSEELAGAQKDLAAEKKSMAQTQSYLADLKHECQETAATWEVEMRDGKAEVAALDKAMGILGEKFGDAAAASFIQTSSKTMVRARAHAKSRASLRGLQYNEEPSEAEDARRTATMRFLTKLGRRLHSTALVSLAYRAGSDPFFKIKGMLEEMVEKLLQEAAQEADQKAFCDKEVGESKASLADKEGKLDTISARIGKAEAAVGRLTAEVSALRREVSEMDVALSNATKLRIAEKEEFARVSKDFQESEEACGAAIQVLREYYDGASSFLQLKSTTRSRSRMHSHGQFEFGGSLQEFGASTQTGGEAIVGMLEVAESDFAKMLAEAKANENMAEEEFAKNTQDSQVLKAVKLQDLKGKESEIKTLQTSLDNLSQDKDGTSSELQAVMEYVDKLKPQCETRTPSYEETKARRQQEIEGLKNALSILSGTAVPVSLSQLDI